MFIHHDQPVPGSLPTAVRMCSCASITHSCEHGFIYMGQMRRLQLRKAITSRTWRWLYAAASSSRCCLRTLSPTCSMTCAASQQPNCDLCGRLPPRLQHKPWHASMSNMLWYGAPRRHVTTSDLAGTTAQNASQATVQRSASPVPHLFLPSCKARQALTVDALQLSTLSIQLGMVPTQPQHSTAQHSRNV